jgi:hypothetical protein
MNELTPAEYYKMIDDDFKACIERGIANAKAIGIKAGLPEDLAELLANKTAEMELNRMAMANWIGPKDRPNG